jgi:hypothetical protein
MRPIVVFAIAVAVSRAPLGAQSVARSVAATDGLVQVIFPSRSNLCGDGVSFIQVMNGRNNRMYIGSGTYESRDGWRDRPCYAGPVRVVASVESGQVIRLKSYVGPIPDNTKDTRTINASAADAVVWLVDLAQRAGARVASSAIQSMTFAAASTPWDAVLRIARDAYRPSEVRREATTWLAYGVTEKLGLADLDENRTDDDEMRTQAVFVLSQMRKSESVPELIDLVKTAKNQTVRKSAIFWLGQSGDARAVDVYAELLGLR